MIDYVLCWVWSEDLTTLRLHPFLAFHSIAFSFFYIPLMFWEEEDCRNRTQIISKIGLYKTTAFFLTCPGYINGFATLDKFKKSSNKSISDFQNYIFFPFFLSLMFFFGGNPIRTGQQADCNKKNASKTNRSHTLKIVVIWNQRTDNLQKLN